MGQSPQADQIETLLLADQREVAARAAGTDQQ